MSKIHVEASRIIAAHPEEVYAILADYNSGHPAILPRPYFTGIEVEQGGLGAGTVITTHMKVMGVERVNHFIVSEPEPGRVLVEADEEAGVVTSFTFDPVDGGLQTRLTITTDMTASPGVVGWVERMMNPPVMRNIYQAELDQIVAYFHPKP